MNKKEAPFTLWKQTSEGISFGGKGRPGWHTECAVMNHSFLTIKDSRWGFQI